MPISIHMLCLNCSSEMISYNFLLVHRLVSQLLRMPLVFFSPFVCEYGLTAGARMFLSKKQKQYAGFALWLCNDLYSFHI